MTPATASRRERTWDTGGLDRPKCPTSYPESEQYVAGFGLVADVIPDGTAILDELLYVLEPGAFSVAFASAIWGAASTLRRRGTVPTLPAILPAMAEAGWNRGWDDLADYADYADLGLPRRGAIYAIQAATGSLRGNLLRCAGYILDAAARRQLVADSTWTKTDAERSGSDAVGVIDRARSRLAATEARLRAGTAGRGKDALLSEIVQRIADGDPDGGKAIPTPWGDLNAMLRGGLVPGRVYVVAGRTSMGKTTLARNMALHAALAGQGVRYVSLEESAEDSLENLTYLRAGVDRGLRGRRLEDGQIARLHEAARDLSVASLDVIGSSSALPLNADRIVTLCQQWSGSGVQLVVVDYLQLVPITRVHGESRAVEVGRISATLCMAARECGLAMVLLAQLNRQADSRSDNEPKISDLRESGAIEQDADAVLLIYRPEYYEPKNPDLRGKAEVIVGKNRQGRTGRVALVFDATTGAFRSEASEWARDGRAPSVDWS